MKHFLCADGDPHDFGGLPFVGLIFCGNPEGGGSDGLGIFVNYHTTVTNGLVIIPKDGTNRKADINAIIAATKAKNRFAFITLNHKGMAEKHILGVDDVDEAASLDYDEFVVVVKVESISDEGVVHAIKYPDLTVELDELENQTELGPGYKATYFLGQLDCIDVIELPEKGPEDEEVEDEGEESNHYKVVRADEKAA